MMKKAALSLSICLLLSAGGCKPASPSGSSGASAASQPAAPYSEREEDSSVSPLLQEVAGETEQYPSLLNFPVSEIDRIDVSSYVLPNQISEKTVTRTEDFQTIWDALTALTVIRNAEKRDVTYGDEVLTFTFHLKNGEILMVGISGSIVSSAAYCYTVEGPSLLPLWDGLEYPVRNPASSE